MCFFLLRFAYTAASRHFFCKKMANEDASLLFTARRATSLKRRSLFFTSSQKTRSLAYKICLIIVSLYIICVFFLCRYSILKRLFSIQVSGKKMDNITAMSIPPGRKYFFNIITLRFLLFYVNEIFYKLPQNQGGGKFYPMELSCRDTILGKKHNVS